MCDKTNVKEKKLGIDESQLLLLKPFIGATKSKVILIIPKDE